MLVLTRLNQLTGEQAREQFFVCCGSTRWAEQMQVQRPFQGVDELLQAAETVWSQLAREDWLEAFSHHPKIGDLDSLREKFTATRNWAAREQAGVDKGSESVLNELAEGNRQYEARFGHIFIVCATGKSAAEMLGMLKERLNNNPSTELPIAAREQLKITQIRLRKLLQT